MVNVVGVGVGVEVVEVVEVLEVVDVVVLATLLYTLMRPPPPHMTEESPEQGMLQSVSPAWVPPAIDDPQKHSIEYSTPANGYPLQASKHFATVIPPETCFWSGRRRGVTGSTKHPDALHDAGAGGGEGAGPTGRPVL